VCSSRKMKSQVHSNLRSGWTESPQSLQEPGGPSRPLRNPGQPLLDRKEPLQSLQEPSGSRRPLQSPSRSALSQNRSLNFEPTAARAAAADPHRTCSDLHSGSWRWLRGIPWATPRNLCSTVAELFLGFWSSLSSAAVNLFLLFPKLLKVCMGNIGRRYN
jgi:hypothetical protein